MAQEKQYWLLKTEADTFSIDDLQRKKTEPWSGVRNYQARNWLRAMRIGNLCFIYHTGNEKRIVGLCKVVSTPYPEEDADWTQVDVAFVKKFKNAVSLAQIKSEPELRGMVLVKNSRLSVQPVTPQQFAYILKISV